MIQRFKNYIEENHLFNQSDTILVGVSGGTDSVVLLDLLDKAGYSVVIAHCNFNLRGEESDRDERLVIDLGHKYDVPVYKTAFDTYSYAAENKISIEMAARDLRYEWFETIRSTHHYDYIAVAHHRDDQLETFFLNLARGTGVNGLTGMRPINGRIVRPLLFSSRLEIEKYRRKNFLEFNEDSSNQSIDFQRNKIRHNLLPVMETLNPSFREGLIKTMGYLEDIAKISERAIALAWERVIVRKEGDLFISIAELKLLDPISTYLFEFLRPFGFNSVTVEEIIASLNGISGKQFLSLSHRIVHDRDSLILTKLIEENKAHYYLDSDIMELATPVPLKIRTLSNDSSFRITSSQFIAYIDLDKVQFPLLIRRWQNGDYFKPLGMEGFKKVSDFFIDSKLSLPEKEKVWILANGEQIIWIMGHRLDERFKITHETRQVLVLELIEK
jgi:tRNA(Ile)-lysidine synthase